MRELTVEWVEKVENDYRTARVVLEQIDEPIVDAACFHCQQCAEKYLKAFLTDHQIEFVRQHTLIPLLELCMQVDAAFQPLLSELRTLEGYAVAVRYPGASVTFEMAKKRCRQRQLCAFLSERNWGFRWCSSFTITPSTLTAAFTGVYLSHFSGRALV